MTAAAVESDIIQYWCRSQQCQKDWTWNSYQEVLSWNIIPRQCCSWWRGERRGCSGQVLQGSPAAAAPRSNWVGRVLNWSEKKTIRNDDTYKGFWKAPDLEVCSWIWQILTGLSTPRACLAWLTTTVISEFFEIKTKKCNFKNYLFAPNFLKCSPPHTVMFTGRTAASSPWVML